jgi:hypothetical protein
MKIITSIKIATFSLFIMVACEKQEGEGGTSTIRGKVITREYNGDFTKLRAIYPAAKKDVYIIYGNDSTEVYGDNMETNWDGSYEFNFLQEGDYIIFAYSKDSTLDYEITSQEIAVMKRVEITGKNQTRIAPVIYTLK